MDARLTDKPKKQGNEETGQTFSYSPVLGLSAYMNLCLGTFTNTVPLNVSTKLATPDRLRYCSGKTATMFLTAL